MGNLCSGDQYDRDAVLRNLWKSQRAIPVLPINPNLDALRVLYRKSDGFHDVGTVYSLCKAGTKKEWLKHEVYSQRRSSKYRLPHKNIGHQTSVISDDKGALAKALVGPAYAAAWFKTAESIEVCIPQCEIREFNMEKWEEMMEHFDPDLQTSILGSPEWNGKRDLFIVQKVVLVSQIKITASYERNGTPEVKTAVKPPQGVNLDTSVRNTSDRVVREFTLTAQKQNQKLPVAFSGFSYKYDRFGVREHVGTCAQSDGEIGESSGTSEGDSESDDEVPQTDPNMGMLLHDNEWFASINPLDLEIFPSVEEPSDGEGGQEEEEEEEEDEVVDSNAPGLEDID